MILPDIGFVYRLISQYGESHRAYHNSEHLRRMFNYLKAFKEEGYDLTSSKVELDLELMFWCIVYHDWVYIPGAKDNEEKSAEAAMEFLVHYPKAQMVQEIILASKTHDRVSEEEMATELGFHKALLLDLDLAHLGGPEGVFSITDAQVAQEFIPVYGEEAYMAGRKEWCQGMVEKAKTVGLFNFPYFQANNQQAIVNLSR